MSSVHKYVSGARMRLYCSWWKCVETKARTTATASTRGLRRVHCQLSAIQMRRTASRMLGRPAAKLRSQVSTVWFPSGLPTNRLWLHDQSGQRVDAAHQRTTVATSIRMPSLRSGRVSAGQVSGCGTMHRRSAGHVRAKVRRMHTAGRLPTDCLWVPGLRGQHIEAAQESTATATTAGLCGLRDQVSHK